VEAVTRLTRKNRYAVYIFPNLLILMSEYVPNQERSWLTNQSWFWISCGSTPLLQSYDKTETHWYLNTPFCTVISWNISVCCQVSGGDNSVLICATPERRSVRLLDGRRLRQSAVSNGCCNPSSVTDGKRSVIVTLSCIHCAQTDEMGIWRRVHFVWNYSSCQNASVDEQNPTIIC
jgi:hypothetical protein